MKQSFKIDPVIEAIEKQITKIQYEEQDIFVVAGKVKALRWVIRLLEALK